MKVFMNHNHISSYTIQHLCGWIESIAILMETEEWPFSSMEELAIQLEHWRAEFQRINRGIVASEQVLVMLYGEEVILIANQVTGEFVTLSPSPLCQNPEMS